MKDAIGLSTILTTWKTIRALAGSQRLHSMAVDRVLAHTFDRANSGGSNGKDIRQAGIRLGLN